MKKESPLGPLHSDSCKRNAYDRGPLPAKGFPTSVGSAGSVKTFDQIRKEDAAKKE
jgi:hypothetical protein